MLSKSDKEWLTKEGMIHVHLGDDFYGWCFNLCIGLYDFDWEIAKINPKQTV